MKNLVRTQNASLTLLLAGGIILLALLAVLPKDSGSSIHPKQGTQKSDDSDHPEMAMPWEAPTTDATLLCMLNTPLSWVISLDGVKRYRWSARLLRLEGQPELLRRITSLKKYIHNLSQLAAGMDDSIQVSTRWTLRGLEITRLPRMLFAGKTASSIAKQAGNTGEFFLHSVDDHTFVGGYRLQPPARLRKWHCRPTRSQKLRKLLSFAKSGQALIYYEPRKETVFTGNIRISAVLVSIHLNPDGAYITAVLLTDSPCVLVRKRLETFLVTPHRGWEFDPEITKRLYHQCSSGMVRFFLSVGSTEFTRTAQTLGLLKRLQ